MKDRKESWLQIIIPSFVTLAFSGGGIWVITEFEARLPNWFYHLIIITVAVVFVALLIFLLILIIRAAFGDWFVKLRRWYEHRSYYKNRLKISEDWRNKWISLSETLLNANSNDWRVSDEEQNKYRSLRNWLRLNRSKFLPIWGLFRQNREPSAHERVSSSSDLMHKVFYKSYEDPFSYFYSPLSIGEFARILLCYQEDTPHVLLRLKERLDELIEWIQVR